MSSTKRIGIEDARKRLGDLVEAVQQGGDIIITRNGRPAARLTRPITGTDVVRQMYRQIVSVARHEPFDLITHARRAAALLLGESEYDLRTETQLRVIETAELGIVAMCRAVGAVADALTEQPTELATIDRARSVMATLVEAPRIAGPVDDERRLANLIDTAPDID